MKVRVMVVFAIVVVALLLAADMFKLGAPRVSRKQNIQPYPASPYSLQPQPQYRLPHQEKIDFSLAAPPPKKPYFPAPPSAIEFGSEIHERRAEIASALRTNRTLMFVLEGWNFFLTPYIVNDKEMRVTATCKRGNDDMYFYFYRAEIDIEPDSMTIRVDQPVAAHNCGGVILRESIPCDDSLKGIVIDGIE